MVHLRTLNEIRVEAASARDDASVGSRRTGPEKDLAQVELDWTIIVCISVDGNFLSLPLVPVGVLVGRSDQGQRIEERGPRLEQLSAGPKSGSQLRGSAL